MGYRKDWLIDNCYEDKDGLIHTKSTRFLTPMVGFTRIDFELSNGNNMLLNTHIDKSLEPIIYVVCDFDDRYGIYDIEKNAILYKISKFNPHLIESFKDDNDREIILKYNIPGEYIEDYYRFLNGMYSKFSKNYKDKLKLLYGEKTVKINHKTTTFDSIYPQSFKKKQIADWLGVDYNLIGEVESKPDLKYEIYKNIQELKDNNKEQEESYEHR